ncbi:MAG: T9SS type A sorting domain-containing protein [Flavobacteriales bacterium]|nr:T9SS type A sorting domain-containing protein [Flavobacteriales bacterium]
MTHVTLRAAALGLVLGLLHTLVPGQVQTGVPFQNSNASSSFYVHSVRILSFQPPNTPFPFQFSNRQVSDPVGTSSGAVTSFASMPDGIGNHSIALELIYAKPAFWNPVAYDWDLYINGAECAGCSLSESFIDNPFPSSPNYARTILYVSYPAVDDPWDQPDQSYEFAFRPRGGAFGEFRFQAVMVGARLSETLGHFTAPQTPAYILRDPPGDMSYSQIQTGNTYCYGETFSVADADATSGYTSVTVGTSQSVGFLVETEISVSLTGGISSSREETSAENKEYMTCLTTTATYTTPGSGPRADDLFIGSAVRYAYGVEKMIGREVGGGVSRKAHLGITPTASSSSFAYTESDIINTAIPQAQALADALSGDPNNVAYKQAVNQVTAWQNALQLNEDLKADAIANTTPNYQLFSGGGATTTFDESITTSTSRSMDMLVVLEDGLSLDFALDVGGSGIAAGGEISVRREVGQGVSGSNESTTTHTMSFGDENSEDHFELAVYKDQAFGAPVFGELGLNSLTSCPYEGGYQLDQPHLSVTDHFQESEVAEEITIGSTHDFQILIHNHSTYEREYLLRVNNASNTNGAVLQAFGQNFPPAGIPIDVPGDGSLESVILSLTQPNINVLDFDSIELVLYSECDPDMSSSIFLSAHFGADDIGMDEHKTLTVRTYPSPATDQLKVELGTDGRSTLHILDLSGRILRAVQVTGPTTVLDVMDLANGEYILRTESAGNTGTGRFSVMR